MRLGFCHSLITQWMIPSLPSTAVTVTFTDTLGKWPRTLGLVRNDIHTCGKQKSKSSTSRWDRSIAETPRDTRPVPLKSYDGQWNPGGSPSLSRQRLTCITIADVSLLDYTVMLRCELALLPAAGFYAAYAVCEGAQMHQFEAPMVPVGETTDRGRAAATHSNKHDR